MTRRPVAVDALPVESGGKDLWICQRGAK